MLTYLQVSMSHARSGTDALVHTKGSGGASHEKQFDHEGPAEELFCWALTLFSRADRVSNHSWLLGSDGFLRASTMCPPARSRSFRELSHLSAFSWPLVTRRGCTAASQHAELNSRINKEQNLLFKMGKRFSNLSRYLSSATLANLQKIQPV